MIKSKTKTIAFRVTPAEHKFYKKSKKLTADLFRVVLKTVQNSEELYINAVSDEIFVSLPGDSLTTPPELSILMEEVK